jgi:hemolysin activation/secretion protein
VRFDKRFYAVVAMACAASHTTAAQTLPPATLRSSPLERVGPLTPPAAPLPSLTLPEAPATAPPPGAASIFLTPSAIDVEGVTAYPPARIAALTQPLVGTRIPATEVFALAQRIEKLYRDDGYFLTLVVVPQQAVADGRVRLRVTEGYIGSVTIEGDAGTSRARVERILNRITESRPARIDQVERQLLLADDTPGVRLSTVLRRGAAPGSSDMIVQIEHARFDAVAAMDNRGSRFQGPLQIYGAAGWNTPTRLGDRLQFSFFSTGSREQNFGQLDYTVPLTDSGLKLRVWGGTGRTEPDLVLRDLGYEGDIGVAGGELTYPLVRTRDRNLILGSQLDYYVSRTSVGRASPLSGKVLSAQSDVRSFRFSANGDLRDAWNGYNAASLRFSKGLDIFGPTEPNNPRNERPGADPLYFATRAEISRVQALWSEEWFSLNLLGLIAGQYSTDVLPASEQFYLGGNRLGRGYYSGEVAGDKALAGTAELQFNFTMTNDLVQPNEPIPVQLYAFYDIGTVRNLSPNDTPSNRVRSVGFGARVEFSPNVAGEVEATQRLKLDVGGPNVKDLPESSVYGRLIVRY